MATSKEINLFINFRQNTPDSVIQELTATFAPNSDNFLTNGYRHPCGKPHFDFYLDDNRPEDYKTSDGTYYLRYANTIKDYENKFEAWLQSLAPYICQVNGYNIGTIVNSDNETLTLIAMRENNVFFLPLTEKE